MPEYFTRVDILQAAAVIYNTNTYTIRESVNKAFELAAEVNTWFKDKEQ
jgi:hypothetical protein